MLVKAMNAEYIVDPCRLAEYLKACSAMHTIKEAHLTAHALEYASPTLSCRLLQVLYGSRCILADSCLLGYASNALLDS